MKKEEKLKSIGKKLGITEKEIKSLVLRNRNKIVAAFVFGIATAFIGKIWFEPLHYTAASWEDFDFFTRFF